TVPKTYRSELILRTNSLASSIVIEGIENLNNAFKSKNYEEVSKLLNVNESEMSKIYHLEVYYGMAPGEVSNLGMPRFYTRSDKVDTIPDGMVSKYIKIVAEVFDEDVYPKLTLGLLYFINSGSFGNGLNVARVEQIKAQIAHAEQGITALQQLLINYTYSKGNTISNLPLQMEMGSLKSEPVQLYDAIDALYSRKSELEQELTLFSQLVAIIADFNKTYRIVQQPHIYILWGAVAAFVLGFFGLLLWDNRKKFANDNSGKT
ncbi:MAG: hypothetical protein LBH84_04295, partial [Prevotellaceae bacterium]|nr:hypothetical protein [Prevotellaceae bacterium]